MTRNPRVPSGLISTANLAKLMGGDWDTDRIRYLLKSSGAGFQLRDKNGVPRGGWFTTRSKLRELSPELFDELSDVVGF